MGNRKSKLFYSEGNIRPWGRDFWSHNLIAEILVVGGGAILGTIAIFAGLIFLVAIIYGND